MYHGFTSEARFGVYLGCCFTGFSFLVLEKVWQPVFLAVHSGVFAAFVKDMIIGSVRWSMIMKASCLFHLLLTGMGCTSSHITDAVNSDADLSPQPAGENSVAPKGSAPRQDLAARSEETNCRYENGVERKSERSPDAIPPAPGNEEKENETKPERCDAAANELAVPHSLEDGSSCSSFDLSVAIDKEIVVKDPGRGGLGDVDQAGEDGTQIPSERDGSDGSELGESMNYSADDAFNESADNQPQEEKTRILKNLLEEFNMVSEDPSDLGNILPVLYSLLSVVLHERSAFVLHQFYLLMHANHSIDSILRVLYANKNSSDCLILCVRLLLFFFVNSDNSKESIMMLIQCRGIPIIISVLQEYADVKYIFMNNVCLLFSLICILSQNGPFSSPHSFLELFCHAFVGFGGLKVLYTFVDLIVTHHIYSYLDISAPSESERTLGTERAVLENEQYLNVKNLLYYICYILALLSRYGSSCALR